MKQSPELMGRLLDELVDYPVHKAACGRVGLERRTLYRWLRTDQTDPSFIFEWNGETAHFAAHFKTAMRLSALQIEANARRMATEGFEEIVTKDGAICWHVREDIVREGNADADKETLMMLYGQPDIFQRDGLGNRIAITVKRAPPAQLVNKMLSAHFPRLYGDHSTVNVNNNGPSVLVVGNKQAALPATVDVTPKQLIQQAPPVQSEDMAEVVATETLPPDLEPDTENEGPPVFNAEAGGEEWECGR